jgi:hypothetical protein
MIKIDKNEAKMAYYEKSTLPRRNLLPGMLFEHYPLGCQLDHVISGMTAKEFNVQLLQVCLNVLSTEPRQRQAAIGHTSDKSLRCKVQDKIKLLPSLLNNDPKISHSF